MDPKQIELVTPLPVAPLMPSLLKEPASVAAAAESALRALVDQERNGLGLSAPGVVWDVRGRPPPLHNTGPHAPDVTARNARGRPPTAGSLPATAGSLFLRGAELSSGLTVPRVRTL